MLFDAVIWDYPETENGLKHDADILQSKKLESADWDLREQWEAIHSTAERKAVEELKIKDTRSPTSNEGLIYAQRAVKSRRLGSSTTAKYLDVRFLISTSNIYERRFSVVGYAMN